MSTRNFYPDVFPGTRIDFSNSTMLPNSLEFGRASTGTYTDQNGIIRTAIPGEPRFVYEDTNGQSGITLSINAGTNAAKSTWSVAAVNAYDSLIVKGWTISFNP